MRRLILTAALFLGLAALASAEPQRSEIPIIKQFLICEGALSKGCDKFARGDFAPAFQEFSVLAGLGEPKAQNNLGVLYEAGAGVPENKAAALKLYRKAADLGVGLAQHNLGVLFAADYLLGTAPNPSRKNEAFVAAYMWLTLAARQGLEVAANGRKQLARHMRPAQIAEAEGLARTWRPNFPDRARVTAESLPSRQLIRRIQKSLRALGYDPGQADGHLGPRTSAAIRAFEGDHGLPITGKASQDLDRAIFLAQMTRGLKERSTKHAAAPEKHPKSPGLGQRDVIRDAPQMSTWQAKMLTIYKLFLQAVEYSGQVDEIATGIINQEVSKDYGVRNGRHFILKSRLSYDKASKQLDCCLSGPNVRIDEFVKKARVMSQYLHTLRDQVRDIIESTEVVFTAAIEGDVGAFNKLQFKGLDQFIIMLGAENVMMSTQKLFTKETHPQHSLFAAYTFGNIGMVGLVSHIGDLARGRAVATDINASQILVQTNLTKMEQAVDRGRKTILNWRVKISRMPLKTERDQHLAAVLTEIIDTYEESFDIEEQMALTISSMAKTFIVDSLIDAPLDLWEKEYLKIEVIVERRMQLQEMRTHLVGKMAAR